MWYQFSTEEVEKKLRTRISSGLDEAQATKRLAETGPNLIPEAKADSLLVIFFRQFWSPLIFVLIIASAVLFFLENTTDALVILFVLVFNAIIGTIQEGRTRSTLSALKHFAQTNATVLRNEKEIIIPDTNLVPGDVIMLEEGEKVPADARVIISNTLAIDEAALTGESQPVHKTIDIISAPNIQVQEQKNMVFKGTYIMSGNGRAVVTATGQDTIIGKISRAIEFIDTEIPLRANVRYLSHLILFTVIIIVTTLFIGGIATGKTAFEMFKVAVSLSVSLIPEGLPIVLTIVLVSGVSRMARRNALVKRLQAVEALGQARVIAVDKTGTITKNELVIKNLYVNGTLFDVSGTGYDPHGEIRIGNEPVDPPNHPELLMFGKIAAFCANAHIAFMEKTNTYKVTGDPTEAALLVFAQKMGFHKMTLENESPKISEIPFNYNSKYHATSHLIDGKQFISVVGSPEAITVFSKKILKDGKEELCGQKEREEIDQIFYSLSNKGLRVVACGIAELPLGRQFENPDHLPPLTFLGFYGMQDTLREEVRSAVLKAQNAGTRVVLITGDHQATAAAIAKEAGIYREGDAILSGSDIDALSDDILSQKVRSVSVFARVTPEHKLRIIQAYKRNGQIIAMTGDGINDAPSLVAADLGIAMGNIGTEVAKEASDIILLDDNFDTIVAAIEEGRNVYKSIKKVMLYLFSTSIGEALTIAGALVLGYPLPILAVQIIWLNLVTDGFLDVALAMDPKEKGLLTRTFVRPNKYLIDALMVKRMFVMALPMMFGALYLFTEYYEHDLAKAMTVSLTVLAVFQWFNAWNCRDEEASLFTSNPLTNKYLIAATGTIVALHLIAVYAPFMQIFLKTVSLSLNDWIWIVGVAFTIVITEETRKLIHRVTHV